MIVLRQNILGSLPAIYIVMEPVTGQKMMAWATSGRMIDLLSISMSGCVTESVKTLPFPAMADVYM